MAKAQMDSSWQQVLTNIHAIWCDVEFDDKELKQSRGNLRKMVSLIHEKTGENETTIMQKMHSAF